ncbi:ArnT family glycosyltransferase [Candidatus Margulisiibacteriota bacterium]
MKFAPRQIGLIAVILVSVLISGLIVFNLILPAGSFHWDESHHGVYGVWLTQSVTSGDWAAFWHHTHRQALWPFLHSWVLTIFFLIFGISFQAARLSSLVLTLATTAVVYLLSVRLSEKWGWLIGLISASLMLTSPLVISFSAQNMLEALGGWLFMLAVYVYLLSEEKKQWPWYVLLGFLLGLSVVTKYNYAIMILAGFLAVKILELYGIFRRPKEVLTWLYRNGLVLAPFLLLALSWFFSGDSDRKIQMLFWSKQMVAEQQNVLGGFWTNIAFYPLAIINDYLFSPWLGVLVLLSILVPIASFKIKQINRFYILIWVPLLLAVFVIGNKMNRLIYIFVPLIFIVFAATLVFLLERLLAKNLKRWQVGLIISLIFLPAVFSLPRIPRMLAGDISDVVHGLRVERGKEHLADVLAFFHDNIPKDKPVSTALSTAGLSPYVFYFYFHDWQAPVQTRFQMSQPYFYRSEYYLTLELDEPDKFGVIDDSVNSWNKILVENLQAGKLEVFKEQDFDTIGVTGRIYRVKL